MTAHENHVFWNINSTRNIEMPPKMPKAIIFSTVGLSVGLLVIWRVSKASDWLTVKPCIQFSAKLLVPGALMYNIKYNIGRVSRRKPAGLHHFPYLCGNICFVIVLSWNESNKWLHWIWVWCHQPVSLKLRQGQQWMEGNGSSLFTKIGWISS